MTFIAHPIPLRAGPHEGTDYDEAGEPQSKDLLHITVSFAKDGEPVFYSAHGYTNGEAPSEDWRITGYAGDDIWRNWSQEGKNGMRIWPEVEQNTRIETHNGKPYPDVEI